MAHSQEEPSPSQEVNSSPRVTIVERMTPWKARGENPESKIYGIDIHTKSGVIKFADLSTDENESCFIWPGRIDFSNLETTAVEKVSSLFTSGKEKLNLDDEATQKATQTIFIMKGKHDSLREFALSNSRQLAAYKKTLIQPDKIAFARYDIVSPTLTYSFTADNPETDQQDVLTISLPYSQHWTEDIVSFALQTHTDKSAFEITEADIKTVTELLLDTTKADKLALETLHGK